MKSHLHLLLSASCVLLVLAPLLPAASAVPPSYFEDGDLPFDDEYVQDDELDRLLQNAQKRSPTFLYRRACVPRRGTCDHRPEDCCYNNTCRCNLWGANCRCQRKGLFQKWGK